jgi:hemolysin III
MEQQATRSERFADNCIHIAGIAAGCVGVLILLAVAIPTLPAYATGSLVVYAVGMLTMFGCSAAYHMTPAPAWKPVLRRIDQAAIFVKIAATYTPFVIVKMGYGWGYGLLAVIWATALAGATAKLLLTNRWDGISLALYLALGWAAVITLYPLSATVPASSLFMLGAGGVLYTLGVVFHVWHSLPYQNAIWHVFVLAGTACHFASIVIAVFN